MSRAKHLLLDEKDLDALTHVLGRAHQFMDRLRYPHARPRPVDGRDWYAFRGEPSPLAAPPPPPATRVVIVRGIDKEHAVPGDWAELAACKNKTRTMYVDNFPVLAHRETALERRQMAEALKVCQSCSVIRECREWAMTDPDPAIDGVAGGMTPRERWEARRR